MAERNIGLVPDGQYFMQASEQTVTQVIPGVFADLQKDLEGATVHIHFPYEGNPEEELIAVEAKKLGWETVGYGAAASYRKPWLENEDFLEKLDTIITIDPEARMHGSILIRYRLCTPGQRQDTKEQIIRKLHEYLLPTDWRPLRDLTPEELEEEMNKWWNLPPGGYKPSKR